MEDLEAYVAKFDPYRDERGWVEEDAQEYANRMHSELLPEWLTEVLIEWLHRHAQFIFRYARLKYESFEFEPQIWNIEQIPGREAFDEEDFCDNFRDVRSRAENPHDWLAHYMLANGTWNTPIVLLHNENNRYGSLIGQTLKQPYHLLEGHRRLSLIHI